MPLTSTLSMAGDRWDHDLKRLTLNDCLAYYGEVCPQHAVWLSSGLQEEEALALVEPALRAPKPPTL